MLDAISAEHPALLDVDRRLIAALAAARNHVQGGEVLHAQHLEYAERAHGLGRLLDSALLMAQADRYAHAFALLRGALEHHVFDQLFMLARKFTMAFTEVSQQDWEQWQIDRKNGEPWTRGIVDWEYRKGNPRITYAGYHNAQKPAETLSRYYFLGREYNPFQGRPEEQPLLDPHFASKGLQEDWARQSQKLYSGHFGWKALVEGLSLNGLITSRNRFRLGVHYRFLSAFVHPLTDQSRLLYGNNVTGFQYDHYSSELILLYIAVIGAGELTTLRKALAMPPRTTLTNDDAVRDLIEAAEQAAAHLWFPGQSPHAYDRVQEANNRQVIRGRWPSPNRTPPERVRPGTVRYYRNPLTRLVQMHRSQQELTGWGYASPWPRGDSFPR